MSIATTGLVIGGQRWLVPGLTIRSFLDDDRLTLMAGRGRRPRQTKWVRSVVLHTTKGIPGGKDHRPQQIRKGGAPAVDAGLRCVRAWENARMPDGNARPVGAHLVVDFDGSVTCHADLSADAAFHAGPVNEVSIGIELYQGNDAELYSVELEAAVTLVDFLTGHFSIQRQIPPLSAQTTIARISSGGEDVVGVYGHRHVTSNRGPGCPGDAIFGRLAAAGYEMFDFNAGGDIAAWRERQYDMGFAAAECDGVPGPRTVMKLAALGRPHGLWTPRPVVS